MSRNQEVRSFEGVQDIMSRFWIGFGLGLGALILVSGCNPKSGSTYEGATNPAGKGSSDLGSGTTNPETKLTPDKIKPEINFNSKTFPIQPRGTGNYKESDTRISELGAKIDKSLAELSGALGKCNANFEVAGAKTTGESVWKAKDPKTYHIQYLASDTEATTNRLISDGTRNYSFFKETWTDRTKVQPGSANTDELIAGFPEHFTRSMLARYESRTDVFGPLFESIANGKRGYSGSLEEQTAKVFDKDRKVYRLLAKRKNPPAELEIVVDGERYLPLTIRSVVPTKDGKDTRMWTCQWMFGGKFEDKEFLIPMAAKGP